MYISIKQTDVQTKRQKDKEAMRQIDKETMRQWDKGTKKRGDKKTNRLTNIKANRHIIKISTTNFSNCWFLFSEFNNFERKTKYVWPFQWRTLWTFLTSRQIRLTAEKWQNKHFQIKSSIWRWDNRKIKLLEP